MPSEIIGEYEIDYSGVALPDDGQWAAYLSIYGPSPNPMHRDPVFPLQRVAVETVFPSEEAAQAAAHEVAMTMVS